MIALLSFAFSEWALQAALVAIGAMRTVLEVSGVDPRQIHQAMLGTTQCTNAIVERKNLASIGILRIGAPATTGIRPMVDWAEDIQKVAVGSTIIGGGFEYDGTLMTMEHARRYPILTVACGPMNSIRGASYLSSLKDAVVVDVGGTTTDLGVIQNGFPRESSVAVTIGGVRTNFRMPDVISIGLGGGSIVRIRDDGSVTVGPDSVGYEITKKALVFGGDVMTATDIAVRLGMVELGDKSNVASIPQDVAEKAMTVIRSLVEDSVDAMKVSNADVDLILVVGGSIILPEKLSGAASVLKPEHFGCANAIGSAISKVSGTYEKLMNYDELPREQSLEKAKKEAIELAVEAGAVRETVEIIEMEDVPLAYYPGNTNRVKIKAAGDLS